MKRCILFFLFLSFKLWSFDYIDDFANASYEGDGHWSDSLQNKGFYHTLVKFDQNHMHVDYHFSDGDKLIDLDFWFLADGWFDVGFRGHKVGEGFCMEDHCQYQIFINGAKISETLGFHDGFLHKFGYKEIDGRIVRWEEELSLTISLNLPDQR